MMRVRLATTADIPAMLRINIAARTDWNEKILQDCFACAYENFIFIKDSGVIAFAVIKKGLYFSELLQICVDPSYQRQKIATRLLTKIIDQHKKPVQLEVRMSNYKAISLYKKLGFHTVGARKKYYRDGEDAVLMTL